MRRKIAALVSTLLATWLSASSAFASLPDSGWYFNAAQSGRGFNIEIQNNALFLAGFIYDASGNPIWVVSGGVMSSDHTYSGAAYMTANGQPLGGAYNAPTNVPFGTATVTWSTTTSATITINGYSFAVSRELFGVDFNSITQPLLGELSFVEGAFGLYFGDRIMFTETRTSSTGPYAAGRSSGGSASRIAVGSYSPGLNKWTILLDSSTSYYEYFVLTFDGANIVEGTASTFLKTDMPGSGLRTVGFRTQSAQAVLGQNAPGIQSLVASADLVGSDAHAATKVARQVEIVMEPAVLEAFARLKYLLQTVETQ